MYQQLTLLLCSIVLGWSYLSGMKQKIICTIINFSHLLQLT